MYSKDIRAGINAWDQLRPSRRIVRGLSTLGALVAAVGFVGGIYHTAQLGANVVALDTVVEQRDVDNSVLMGIYTCQSDLMGTLRNDGLEIFGGVGMLLYGRRKEKISFEKNTLVKYPIK